MAQEIEVKFALSHLGDFRQRLLAEGGRLVRDRVLERNWRYDDAKASLSSRGQVLRLRQALSTTLTYKEPGAEADPLVRTEIELELDQVEAGHALLEALGYRVILQYEKYRETFVLASAEIVLDELPFGSFVEIEAVTIDDLKASSDRLGLEWSRRATASYAELFATWKASSKHSMRDATFEAFQGIERVTPADLGLQPAQQVESGSQRQ